MRRPHVAIGPITRRPSWKWLGPHLAESLAGSCTVRFFRDGALPRCDAAIFVKERPREPLRQALGRGCRIVYMPVDFYESREQLEADAPFLRRCSGVLAHSRRLGAELVRHNTSVWHVDHPNLYGLARKPPYRPDGYLLWVGDFFNLPYVLRWWAKVELPYELRILTNGRRTSITGMAMTVARGRRLGVELDLEPDRVNGIAMHQWDPATQQVMMANAKAALDVKGGEEDFGQLTKPPTKGQQLIVSGIPFATNSGSAIVEDLRDSGFEVADVDDPERWFSHRYWQDTRAFTSVLEARIDPQAVAVAYRRCLDDVLGRAAARPPAPPVRQRPIGPAPARPGAAPGLRDHARAYRLLRRLNASWQDAAPFSVLRTLETLRASVPGYVSCSASGAAAGRGPAPVSVIVDPERGAAAGAKAEPSGEIPASWEVIALRPATPPLRAGASVKSIGRWPRRGTLNDRMLACAYADGEHLAFVGHLDAGTVAWIREAVSILKHRPRTALVRRARDAFPDSDDAESFVVRCYVWRALAGYHRGSLMGFTRCSEIDLFQRIRQLGYAIEPASEIGEGGTPAPGPSSSIGGEMVVYTAITAGYDRLRPLDRRRVEPARRVAFLDEASRAAAGAAGDWEIRDVAADESDPNRRAKRYKIRPELFFPEAKYSLWIDGNVSPIYPFDAHRLVELYLADADLCVFRHHARSCIYEEAEACKLRRLDSAEVIDRQMSRYREDGFPPDHGLHEMVVILRRHTDAVKSFDRLWWDEICRGSRRDQLSFDYVQWKTGLPIAEFPLAIQDHNGLFVKEEHPRRWPPRLVAANLMRAAIRRMEGVHFAVPAGR